MIVPGIAGVSVMSATFIALAYNLTFLREHGVLKRLRGTPLPTGAYLGGVAASAVTNVVLQLAIVITAGHLVFGVAWPGDWVALAVFTALGVVCFASLGVALSHAIPNSESAPAYVNAVFLPMLMIAGVFYDEENAPAVLRDIAEVLPLKHLVDGLSGAIVHGEGLSQHTPRAGSCSRCGPPPGSRSPCAASPGTPGGASRRRARTSRRARRSGPAGGRRCRSPRGCAVTAGSPGAARCRATCARSRAACSTEPQP